MARGERVPGGVKDKVRKPLGRLYTRAGLLAMMKRSRISPKRTIAVGDVTGAFLIESGIRPAVWIYDGKERRKPVPYPLPIPTHIVSNPRGRITLMLRSAIDDALASRKRARIMVQGEEDLAALYVMARARGRLMLYGQPARGIVAVRIGQKEQKKAESLLSQLE